jgi:hypothetical protein
MTASRQKRSVAKTFLGSQTSDPVKACARDNAAAGGGDVRKANRHLPFLEKRENENGAKSELSIQDDKTQERKALIFG